MPTKMLVWREGEKGEAQVIKRVLTTWKQESLAHHHLLGGARTGIWTLPAGGKSSAA